MGSELEHVSNTAAATAATSFDFNMTATVGYAYNASNRSVASGYYESFYAEIAVLLAIGIVGNGQLIALFQRRHRKAFRAVNLYMLLLAITDLTACLWTMPFALLYVSLNLDSEVACKASFYISGAIEMMSMTTSTMIALERFHAVRSPHRPFTSRQAAYARVAGIAGISFVLMSGLVASITIEQGECSLSASRPLPIDIYLWAMSAIIIMVYVCDFVLYAFVFDALRRRSRMAENRRSTLTGAWSSATDRQRAAQIQSNYSVPTESDSENQELSTDELPAATTKRERWSRSTSIDGSLHHHRESENIASLRSNETERTKQEPLTESEAAEAAASRGSAAETSANARPSLLIGFSKRSSLESPDAEPRASRGLKLQQQQQQTRQSSPTAATSTNAVSGGGGGGRLSWSREAGGANWATQEVRSSAFLAIVLLSLISWLPLFMSILFPSQLGLDAPHFRFLFFLNHVINIFVYAALSPHIRAQLKTNLLHLMRTRRAHPRG